MKKILITGGCGFVGVNLLRELLLSGHHEITLLDDLSNAVPGNVDAVVREAENHLRQSVVRPRLLAGDIRDRGACDKAVRGQDAVLHLAAYTRVVESLANPACCFDVNVQGTIHLLEACRDAGVRRFLFASSNAAVGEQDDAVSEDMPARPMSPYGAAKLAGEALCSAYFHSYGMETVALRFTNAYGPYCQRKSSAVAKFMRELLLGSPLTIYGDGRQTRDFVHVADLCRAVRLCCEEKDASRIAGQVFQIATGVETSVRELIDVLIETTGTAPKVVYEPSRAGEIARNRSNISKAIERLAFRAEISLEQGIRDLYDWVRVQQMSEDSNPQRQGTFTSGVSA